MPTPHRIRLASAWQVIAKTTDSSSTKPMRIDLPIDSQWDELNPSVQIQKLVRSFGKPTGVLENQTILLEFQSISGIHQIDLNHTVFTKVATEANPWRVNITNAILERNRIEIAVPSDCEAWSLGEVYLIIAE